MFRFAFIFLIAFAWLSCNENPVPAEATLIDTTTAQTAAAIPSFTHIQNDTTIIISSIAVDILIPQQHKADMLVLPGWNFSRKQPFGDVPVIRIFLDKGYRLILPEMGKSVYASHYFPETRKDWIKYPTLTWITDTMFPLLQDKYGILHEEENNFITGISTGARGVVLIAAAKPVFKAGAAVSGDYDQTLLPGDNLMKGVYGEYAKFSERWKTIDNPASQVSRMTTPLYLAHGIKDNVVPVEQTKHYYEQLHEAQPELEVILSINDSAGHEPLYWYHEMTEALSFFDKMHGK